MSLAALHPGHAAAVGFRSPSCGAARAPFTTSTTAVEPKRHALKASWAERPLHHASCLVSTSHAAVPAQRPLQHCSTGALTTAAALPAAAAERDTVSSDADMGPSGINGSTDQEPALSAEPSSEPAEARAEAQEAATEADEQAQQPAADAHAAASATAAVGSNGAAAPAEADAAVAGNSTASTKPQRRQKDQAGAPRGQQRLQRREPQDRQPTGPVQPIPKEELWIRAGDVVACKVEWSNNRGARVSTLRDPRIIGYMPAKEGPYHIRGETEMQDIPPHEQSGDWGEPMLPIGLVREFQILKVPSDIEYNGRGPLVSARLVDTDLLWARGEQALRMCRERKETVRVAFQELNEGGLMARFLGLRLFMPLSHLSRPEPGKFMSHEELTERYIHNSPTQVGITEVDPFNRRFVCSEQTGLENNVLRYLEVGSLVWGTVRRVQDFGAFIGFDDTRASGLVHISNISRQHVGYTDEVFQVGDRVRAVVLSQEDYSRFSLSTAELEEQPGDMLRDKAKVYENAEEQVKIFLELQAEAAAEDSSHSATDAPRDSQVFASGHY